MSKEKGLSVIIENVHEFNVIKEFLGDDILYLTWHKNMQLKETAVVFYAKKKTNLSMGHVGSSQYHKELGLRVVKYSQFFKLV